MRICSRRITADRAVAQSIGILIGFRGNIDFSQLLQILGGVSPPAESKPAQATQTGGLDIAKLMKIQSIMQSASKPDKNIQLLLALRPLLKEENQAKIDRLIKIFKLFAVYPALKESGLLGGDLLGLF